MDGMAHEPEHAKPAPRPEGLIAAWLCLVIAGVTTVTFNIWHAWFAGMASLIGIMEGVAPVALAMVVSHLVATSRAGKFLKAVTFAVMVGAMALSVRATGAVVRPATGPLWWLYGAVIDTAALVALQVLLSLKSHAAAEAQRRAAEEAAAADELAALRARLETAQEALTAAGSGRADAESRAARQAGLEASLEAERAARGTAEERAAGAERTAQEAEARREILARKLDAANAKLARNSPAKKRATSPRNGGGSSRATKVPDDVDARAEALAIHGAEPGISGAELGRRVGMSPRWGQLRKDEFAAAAPKGQDPQQ